MSLPQLIIFHPHSLFSCCHFKRLFFGSPALRPLSAVRWPRRGNTCRGETCWAERTERKGDVVSCHAVLRSLRRKRRGFRERLFLTRSSGDPKQARLGARPEQRPFSTAQTLHLLLFQGWATGMKPSVRPGLFGPRGGAAAQKGKPKTVTLPRSWP